MGVDESAVVYAFAIVFNSPTSFLFLYLIASAVRIKSVNRFNFSAIVLDWFRNQCDATTIGNYRGHSLNCAFYFTLLGCTKY